MLRTPDEAEFDDENLRDRDPARGDGAVPGAVLGTETILFCR